MSLIRRRIHLAGPVVPAPVPVPARAVLHAQETVSEERPQTARNTAGRVDGNQVRRLWVGAPRHSRSRGDLGKIRSPVCAHHLAQDNTAEAKPKDGLRLNSPAVPRVLLSLETQHRRAPFGRKGAKYPLCFLEQNLVCRAVLSSQQH